MTTTRSMGEIKFRRFLFTLSGAIVVTTAFVIGTGIAFGWNLSLSWSLRVVVGAVIIATVYYEMRQAQLREEHAALEAAAAGGDEGEPERPLTAEELRAFLDDPNTQDALAQYTKRLREQNEGAHFVTKSLADFGQ